MARYMWRTRWLLTAAALALCVADVSVQSPAATLAPTGTLRAVFLGGNPVQGRVDPKTGEATGTVPDLVKELGKRLGVPVFLVSAPNAGDVIGALNANIADIGFLAFDEERVYWLDRRGIMSAPSDGSELPKLVIKSDVRRFAIGDGYLYWTPVISGQEVFRCPIADCASATTPLVTTNAPIVNLQVDGSAMYWIEANAIHSCPLTGCEQSIVLTPPNVADLDFNASNEPAGFALDAGYLYWVETADPLRPGEINYPHGKAIRRTAR